jgi:hypothetical protein
VKLRGSLDRLADTHGQIPGRKQLAEQREGWTRFSGALQTILKTT